MNQKAVPPGMAFSSVPDAVNAGNEEGRTSEKNYCHRDNSLICSCRTKKETEQADHWRGNMHSAAMAGR
jgi:hypothetical protein